MLDQRYPALADLKARARRRIPHFAWEYLDSGTGDELALRRSRTALDAVVLKPAILSGTVAKDLSTPLLGQDFAFPFGIAPLGMSGLFWAGAEAHLARLAARLHIPYGLSTVAAAAPEDIAPHHGGMGWFQLYPQSDAKITADILRRAWEAGFGTLILTVDVPGPSRRERQRRGGVPTPPRLTPRVLWHAAQRPAWSLAMARGGMPRLRTLEGYPEPPPSTADQGHVGLAAHSGPDWDFLDGLRELWPGKIVAKGVLVPEDAVRLAEAGVDALWVSNHGGRQFDGAPGSAEALPLVRSSVGAEVPVIYDGAVASGLDVLKAIALGADFVMLGRAWHWGLGAFGAKGAAHVAHILTEDMLACMTQMGIARPIEARERLWPV